jgi:hypothetical protein
VRATRQLPFCSAGHYLLMRLLACLDGCQTEAMALLLLSLLLCAGALVG